MKVFKGSKLRHSLLRNSIVLFFWWIIFFPGFYSGDSFLALDMAKTGNLTNSGTASWAVFVRVFSLWGAVFPILNIFCGLILIYAVTQLAYALFEDKTAAPASLTLAITPLVSGMGITLWHDIPFTSGIILIVSFFIKMIRFNDRIPRSQKYSLLIPGAILVTFKPNGTATLIVFGLLFLIEKGLDNRIKHLFFAILLGAILTLSLSFGILKQDPINQYYGQEWMRADISCYASTEHGFKMLQSEDRMVKNLFKWPSSEACTFLNNAALSVEEKTEAQNIVPTVWSNIFINDPFFLLKTHLSRHAYLIPIPVSGIPTVPFLHSTVEFKDRGVSWAFPEVAENARVVMRAWNASRGITSWAGIWLLIMASVMYLHKNRNIMPLVQMSIALMGLLFIAAPIGEGRYVLFVLISGQLVFIGSLLDWMRPRNYLKRASDLMGI